MPSKDIHFFYLYENTVNVFVYKQKCPTYSSFNEGEIHFQLIVRDRVLTFSNALFYLRYHYHEYWHLGCTLETKVLK